MSSHCTHSFLNSSNTTTVWEMGPRRVSTGTTWSSGNPLLMSFLLTVGQSGAGDCGKTVKIRRTGIWASHFAQ